ncbi:pyridoxal phosphate-dependent aminotransferase [Thiomonas bhubaneswarensis]|uniref:Aspartate/methionine/tyrosine aminotransferase n=1 Tax=Thiomonas bhubaneswarensis TaxID=339866 RepID=A0A0K6HQF9_9BURK|nr:pyridoxal phosphate-dependent aminotransferase [Thiomonas bhubaneswarensis]CUA93145.1 Aspartate/methionine/tyrosine aminotransferase [Thiomonas bhubaneswarensis]
MTAHTPHLASRLPQVGTTIFTVMSALAQQHGAINLGQGFPDFSCDPRLIDAVDQAMRQGANQYPPMAGVPALRRAVADKIALLYGHRYDADTEITITAGATQAIFTALLAVVHPGDEVIVLTPCYDSYLPNIALCGGVARTVALTADFRPDFDAIAAAITPRTRALLINSPHNPSGTVWSEDDMRQLDALLAPTDIVLISDEVYEHMVFDGAQHQSASRFPGLAARALVVSSFGKTFHVTGWKVGSVAAPAPLTAEFRKVHQFNVFTVNTPMQHGLAAYLADPQPYLQLPAFYQAKRDRFRTGLANSRFELLPCSGSYFQCVRYNAISDLPDEAFCRWLTESVGVAAIPLSAFEPDARQRGVARFCFAKQDATLDEAITRLRSL